MNSALESSYWRVSVVDITGSTQNDLTALIRNNQAREGDVLVTEYQSAGRGRLDRSFIAEPGSALLFSFFIIPKVNPSGAKRELGWIPLLAGQALCAALQEAANPDSPIEPLLKWPNDILINDRKVAGILTERIDSINRAGVVIGIGVNFFANREKLPAPNATSLVIEGFRQPDREELLISFLIKMSEYLKRWENGDSSLLAEYRDRSRTLGQAVTIELPTGEIIEGDAASIDHSGALLLKDGRKITVGDVVHLRTN